MPLERTISGLDLRRKLALLSKRGAENARASVASTVRDLIAEEFANEKNPNGQAWAPRADALPHPILDLTGKMKAGYQIRIDANELTIRNDVVSEQGRPYPLFHQTGTRNMPARRTLPVESLSTRWRSQIDKTAQKALERLE